jgi:nitrogen fixation/metabolism regulation signal transduction histidine kinase
MGFNRFRLFVLLRVLMLFITIAAFVYLIYFDQKYVTTTVMGLLIVFEVMELFQYIESTNKKLRRFFDAIKYNDFNMSFSHDNKLGKTFKELNTAFKEVIDAILLERQKREEFFQELQVVVENIASGIISINTQGEIKLINNAAFKLLDIKSSKHSLRLNIDLPVVKEIIQAVGERNRASFTTEAGKELTVMRTIYKLGNESYQLLALQDIKAELEAKELEAWQNLTKVLRHEIMNSIAPISSLTSTLQEVIKEDINRSEQVNTISQESLEDLEEGLSTISGRSDGLINFINAYRDYTNLPEPVFEEVHVNELVLRTVQLMRAEVKDERIQFISSTKTTKVWADPQLIEQVLINLIKNALEATENRPKPLVEVIIKITNQRPSILISDNGTGMTDEAQQKIFMPFYSTKNRGSGIGLSLSKQIMQMHEGDILLETEIEKGTTIGIIF